MQVLDVPRMWRVSKIDCVRYTFHISLEIIQLGDMVGRIFSNCVLGHSGWAVGSCGICIVHNGGSNTAVIII